MNSPLVSFAITARDEVAELKSLLGYLRTARIPYPAEIVLLIDGTEDEFVERFGPGFDLDFEDAIDRIEFGKFTGDFSAWKNRLSDLCRGEYVFQIDADELPPDDVVRTLDATLRSNPESDLFYLPRMNVVLGITDDDLAEWGWSTSLPPGADIPVVEFPDYQGRLFKRSPSIRWTRSVHEVVTGNKNFAIFPARSEYAILHVKTIQKQREQNARYRILMNGETIQ